MKDRYLEITFRKGKAMAAYLYLPRVGSENSVKTENAGSGLLIDYAADGRPIGIEITAPGHVSPADVNAVLDRLGLDPLRPEEGTPLQAA
jgi:uncharacterized protein YuzE